MNISQEWGFKVLGHVMVETQPLLKNKSGVGWYTDHIVRGILASDYRVTGVAFDLFNRNGSERILKSAGFYDYKINTVLPSKLYKTLWNVAPYGFDDVFGKADLYHFFNYVIPPIKKGKVLTTVYDVAYKRFPETLDKRNLWFLERNMKRTIEQSDLIVTISEASKEEMVNLLGIREERVRIVPCGIEKNDFKSRENISEEETKGIRRKYNLPEKYFLYLGTIEPRKNIDKVIRAYSVLPDSLKKEYKLVIAGGLGWRYDSILTLPNEMGIDDSVHFCGYVEEGDKAAVYALSELFLFPSLYEGFGMPILEAMASGVPVITSNVSSMPEVGGAAALYVDPTNYEEISETLLKLTASESLKKEVVARGYERLSKFKWEQSIEKTLAIYKEMLT